MANDTQTKTDLPAGANKKAPYKLAHVARTQGSDDPAKLLVVFQKFAKTSPEVKNFAESDIAPPEHSWNDQGAWSPNNQ